MEALSASAKASFCSSVSEGEERNPLPCVGFAWFYTSDGHLDDVYFFGNQTRFQPRLQMGPATSTLLRDGEIMNSVTS